MNSNFAIATASVICAGALVGCTKTSDNPTQQQQQMTAPADGPRAPTPSTNSFSGAGNPHVPSGVGFSAHPWCFASMGDDGLVQNRFTFTSGGALAVDEFEFTNNVRGKNLEHVEGKWKLQGQTLTIIIDSDEAAFHIDYKNPDPTTKTERLHIYMDGSDAGYDPCD